MIINIFYGYLLVPYLLEPTLELELLLVNLLMNLNILLARYIPSK